MNLKYSVAIKCIGIIFHRKISGVTRYERNFLHSCIRMRSYLLVLGMVKGIGILRKIDAHLNFATRRN